MYCPIAIKRVVKRDEGLGDVPIIVLETVLEDGKFILGTNKPVRTIVIPLEYHPISIIPLERHAVVLISKIYTSTSIPYHLNILDP